MTMTHEEALTTLASYIDPHATTESVRIFDRHPSYTATRQEKEAWTALRVLVKA